MKKHKDKKKPSVVTEEISLQEQAPAAPEGAVHESAPAHVPPEPTPEEEAVEMRLLRLQADFDNYRKRTLRERTEWSQSALEGLLSELLPVLDHYELGLKTAEKHQAEPSVLDGFRIVYNQFLSALKKFAVTPIDAEGMAFDHDLHEAITYIPSEEHAAGQVITQTRRGYRLGDKLLRAAQVVVSSGPAVPPEEE